MKRNIPLFYLFQLVGSFEFIVPFFIIFLLDRGLTFTQAMLLQAYWTTITLFLEVPSGAFADKVGRVKALQVSSLVVALGFIIYPLSHTITGYIIAETLIAISWAFFSGTDSAFIYDTLKSLKKERLYEKIEANSMILQFIGLGIGGFAGGFLVIYGYESLFYLTAISFFVGFIMTLFLKEPPHYEKVHQKGYYHHILDSIKFARTHKKVRFAILYSAIIGVLTHFIYFLIQPYLLNVNFPEKWYGTIYLIYFLVLSLGYYTTPKITSKISRKKLLGMIPLAMGIFFFLGFIFYSKYSIIFLLLVLIPKTMQNLISLVIINENTKSSMRATVISLKNLMYSLIFTIMAPLIGIINDKYSASHASLALGIIALTYAIYYYVFIKKDIKDKIITN